MDDVERQRDPAVRRLRCVPGEAHEQDCGGRGDDRAALRQELDDRALAPFGALEEDRDRRREREKGDDELEIGERAAEGRHPHQGHECPDCRPRAQRELCRREEQVDRDRDQRERERDGERERHRARRASRRHPPQGSRDDRPEDEDPDARHQREEDEPAGDEQAWCCRRLADRRDHELRRRAGGGAYREGERTANRVTVGGDRTPEDEVPALRERLHRRDERVAIGRRAGRAAGRLLRAARVRDGDDGEPWLDGLAVGKSHLVWLGVLDAARGRERAEQSGVRPARGRKRQGDDHRAPDGRGRPPYRGHAWTCNV